MSRLVLSDAQGERVAPLLPARRPASASPAMSRASPARGGLFVVPLFTVIQANAPKDRRARIVGGVNVLNSAFIVLGVLAIAMLQSRSVRVSEPVLLAALGVLNLGAAFYVRGPAAQGAI